jgi:hypothetical protein
MLTAETGQDVSTREQLPDWVPTTAAVQLLSTFPCVPQVSGSRQAPPMCYATQHTDDKWAELELTPQQQDQ